MANTKNLDPKTRKKVKRKLRRELKLKLGALTLKERKELKKFEGSVKQFLLQKEAEKKKAETKTDAEAPAETT